MKIYLGSDHRGFKLKEKVKVWLSEKSHDFVDLGPQKLNPDDDYTTYGEMVAKKVQENSDSLGVLICGSGVGMDVVANKFDGVRSSVGKNQDQVRAGRNDDNMNMLVIASDFTTDEEAGDMIKTFITTKHNKEDRFERRLNNIKKIEENN